MTTFAEIYAIKEQQEWIECADKVILSRHVLKPFAAQALLIALATLNRSADLEDRIQSLHVTLRPYVQKISEER